MEFRYEKDFEKAIIEFLESEGFLVYSIPDSRKIQNNTAKGFPDIIATDNSRLLFLELKVGKNKPTEEQVGWLEALSQALIKDKNVVITVLRPEDCIQFVEAIINNRPYNHDKWWRAVIDGSPDMGLSKANEVEIKARVKEGEVLSQLAWEYNKNIGTISRANNDKLHKKDKDKKRGGPSRSALRERLEKPVIEFYKQGYKGKALVKKLGEPDSSRGIINKIVSVYRKENGINKIYRPRAK